MCALIGSKRASGFVLLLTGLSGAGKTTIAGGLAADLRARGLGVEVLDGDDLRQSLCRDLGYTREDRERHAERVAFVAERLSRHGVIVIVSLIAPYRSLRRQLREAVPRFVEVYVKCPLAVCAARDVKGLYGKAREGVIPYFTGISDPYEEPVSPEITVETDREPPAASVRAIVGWLRGHGYFPGGVEPTPGPKGRHTLE